MATGDWRMEKRQRMASSEWRIVLEGSAPALPKNFSAHRKTRPPVTESWAHREVRPPKRRINSALREICQIPCPLSRAPCPSLSKASGMGRKIVKGCTPHSALRTISVHSYTLTRLHACIHDGISGGSHRFSKRKQAVAVSFETSSKLCCG
jgi:hypothetical protein